MIHVAIHFFASSKGVGEEREGETIKQEVKHLRVLMEVLKNENKQLKAEVKEKDKQLKDMQEELNRQDISNIDQHHRGWSPRAS